MHTNNGDRSLNALFDSYIGGGYEQSRLLLWVLHSILVFYHRSIFLFRNLASPDSAILFCFLDSCQTNCVVFYYVHTYHVYRVQFAGGNSVQVISGEFFRGHQPDNKWHSFVRIIKSQLKVVIAKNKPIR